MNTKYEMILIKAASKCGAGRHKSTGRGDL